MARRKKAAAFRTISEVADWLGVETHVLRYWETRFKQIKPVKRAGGRRYYRPADMMLIGGLRKLLHVDGLSIKEAQAELRTHGVKHVAQLSPALPDGLSLEEPAKAPTPAVQPSAPKDEPAVIQPLTPVARPVAVTPSPEPSQADTPAAASSAPAASTPAPANATPAPAPATPAPAATAQTKAPDEGVGQMGLFNEDTLAASESHRPREATSEPVPPAQTAKTEVEEVKEVETTATQAAEPQSEPEPVSAQVEAVIEPDIDFDALPASSGVISAALDISTDADTAAISAVLAKLVAARQSLNPRA